MRYEVLLTDDAAYDLEDLYSYIEFPDAPERVGCVLDKSVLDKIGATFSSLSGNPERGTYPNELLAVGMREYREIYFKPYLIIYRVVADKPYVKLLYFW